MTREQLTVCLMNDSFPPTIDGVANCVANYAGIIQRKFGNAVVCTPYYPGVEDHYDYQVIRYPSFDLTRTFGYRAGMPFDKKTIQALRQMPIDVIHIHSPIMSAVLGRTLRELIQQPIVLTYHTKYDVDIRKDIKSKTMQDQAIQAIMANIDSCDAVWTVSEGAGKNLRSLGFQGDYTVMENGVDLPRGGVSPEKLYALNREYGLFDRTPVFLFVGRMMWYKGIRTTLDGLRLLRDQGYSFRMLFVGNGADEQEIKSYAHQLGLNDVCLFIPAVQDREKLRALYTRADLFLFPSDFDTNGLVVREAAACGTASLTLKGSCAAEGITDGQNGLTIENTADALARAVAGVIRLPDTTRLLGYRAMDELYISWEESVSRAYRRYYEVIDQFYANRRERHGKSDAFFRTVAKLYF